MFVRLWLSHAHYHTCVRSFETPSNRPAPSHPHANNDAPTFSSNRCFNQLDLPNYSSKESMRQKLVVAITEGSEGFAMA